MKIMKTAELLYKVRSTCTAIELLFPAPWWQKILKRIGLEAFHGLANKAHNELVSIRGCSDRRGEPIAWDYNAFKSKDELHRLFQDPLKACLQCRNSVRMIPTAKNILMKKLGFKSHKNAVLLASTRSNHVFIFK